MSLFALWQRVIPRSLRRLFSCLQVTLVACARFPSPLIFSCDVVKCLDPPTDEDLAPFDSFSEEQFQQLPVDPVGIDVAAPTFAKPLAYIKIEACKGTATFPIPVHARYLTISE